MVPGSNEEIQKLATMVEFLRRLGEGLGKVLNADVVVLSQRNQALLRSCGIRDMGAFGNEAVRRAGEALLIRRRGQAALDDFQARHPIENRRAAMQFGLDFEGFGHLLRELLEIDVDDPAEAAHG